MENENLKTFGIDRRTFIAGTAAAGAVAATSGILAGCGGSGTGSGTNAGGGNNLGRTIKYYISQPACIDPFDLQESEGTAVSANLFDPLTKYDYVKGELYGAAAESWEISDDATVFTFKIRKGCKFHNGETVTAESFKYAWERMCNPATSSTPSVISYHIDKIVGYSDVIDGRTTALEGVKVLDEYTLEVTLVEPFADFIMVVAHAALVPLPTSGIADDYATFSRSPIGNGPFMMDGEWVDDQYIRTKRFPDYYGETAKIEGCDFVIVSDPDTAFIEFQAGNLDFSQIASGQIESTKTSLGESVDGYTVNPGAQALLGAESSTYYFVMNTKDEVFSNVNIRKAVNMAINRQAICDTIFEGTRKPADGIVPPGIDGYEAGAWDVSKYDVEGAKKALVDAGFPGGEGIPAIKLSCNSGGGHEEIMQMVQADLSVIGIKAELESMEWATYLDALQQGNYQFGRLGWIADYPIMDNFLYSLFYTGTGDNRSQYSNPAFDKKIMEARSITDTEARLAAYKEANAMLAKDAVVAPVMFYCHHHVGSDALKNFYYAPNNVAALNKVEIV